MNFVAFFASPTLEAVSQDIIAFLLYDLANENTANLNESAVTKVFFESIDEGAKNILKSSQTKKRILDALQKNDNAENFDQFLETGQPLDSEYFVTRFSEVISRKNAKKIVPLFLDSFRRRVADDEELSKSIFAAYKEHLRKGQWDLNDDARDELSGFLTSQNGKHVPEEDDAPQGDDAALEVVYFKNNQSGQLVYWNQHEFVLPVRGLRKIESSLKDSSFLCITGAAGCGKSALISAYINNQVANEEVAVKDVYYYRFMEVVSDYEAFTSSLTTFLESQELENTDVYDEDLAGMLAHSRGIYVLDDFHHVLDERLSDLLQKFWRAISDSEEFAGKLLILSREKPQDLPLSNITHFHYKGLSVAESNALLRDKWGLNLPKTVARALAKKILGNPMFMLFFRNWWQLEKHTDTELERFVEYMPKVPEKMLNYLCEHLYDSLERADSRLNTVLKAISLFGMAEEENCFAENYEKIGSSDFQMLLEILVENYELISYDSNLHRYHLHDNLRNFYYDKLESVQIRRILHNNAGLLYRERFEKRQDMVDAVEGARHFQRGEREEEAVRLLEPVMGQVESSDIYVNQILEILKDVNFDLIDNDQGKVNVLYNRGKFYLFSGLLKEAEEDFLTCENLSPPEALQGSILYGLSRISRMNGKTNQSFQLLEEALQKFEAVNDTLGVADSYYNLGEIHLGKGELEPALEFLEQAVIIYEQKGKLEGAHKVYNHIGGIFRSSSRWDAAYEQYEKALTTCEELNNHQGTSEALKALGGIREETSALNEAIGLYYKEMRIREKNNDWLGAAGAYERIGNIYQKRDEWDNAMEFYQEAQDVFERAEDIPGMASVYKNIGINFHGREDWETAMGYYQKSQELYEKIENTPEVGDAFSRMALVYRAMQEWERSLDMFDRSLEIKERQGDTPGIAEIYELIGDIYLDQEQYEYAMEVFERSILMREELNEPVGIAQIYFKIGDIKQAQKNMDGAIGYYQKSLDIFEKLNDIAGTAKAYRAQGKILRATRKLQQSMVMYKNAYEKYSEVNDPEGIGHILYQLGNIYHDSGNWEQALKCYKESLAFFEQIGDLFHFAQSLGNISSIEFERKDHTMAIGKQVEILLYFQETAQKEFVERVLSNLVACHQELGPDTFQALLTNCLEKISRIGVNWGEHAIIPADKASGMISEIFYNAQ